MQLQVARALEFLVDDFVHLRAGIDQRCGDNGEAATFLNISGRAEEPLGSLQCVGVHTTGQYLSGAGDHSVVGASEARNRVEQDHHVAFVLYQSLRLFNHHVGDLNVARGRFVEGRGDDFGTARAHRALHLGHFFRPFVDE